MNKQQKVAEGIFDARLDEFYTILERGLESYKRPIDWQDKPKKLEGRKPYRIQDEGYRTGGTGDE